MCYFSTRTKPGSFEEHQKGNFHSVFPCQKFPVLSSPNVSALTLNYVAADGLVDSWTVQIVRRDFDVALPKPAFLGP